MAGQHGQTLRDDETTASEGPEGLIEHAAHARMAMAEADGATRCPVCTARTPLGWKWHATATAIGVASS